MSTAGQKFAFRFGIWSLILFLVLTTLAMFLYPGGTNVDPDSAGYRFTENFFSDLGRYRTFEGEPKILTMGIFMLALTGAATGTDIYFLAAPRLFTGFDRVLAMVGSIPGVMSGVCYFGIAMTPWDVFMGTHGNLVKAAFSAFLVAIFFYAAATFRSRRLPHAYGWVFLSYSVVLAAYLWLIFFGPSAKTPDGLIIQAVGQKIVVYAQIGCMLVQLMAARRLLKPEPAPDGPRLVLVEASGR